MHVRRRSSSDLYVRMEYPVAEWVKTWYPFDWDYCKIQERERERENPSKYTDIHYIQVCSSVVLHSHAFFRLAGKWCDGILIFQWAYTTIFFSFLSFFSSEPILDEIFIYFLFWRDKIVEIFLYNILSTIMQYTRFSPLSKVKV